MAVSLAAFRALHSEFDSAADALVQEALDEAESRTPLEIWGTKQDQGIRYLAAHLLCIHPSARDMRIGKGGQDKIGNLYDRERQRLARIVTSGFRVVGDTSGITP